MNLLILNGSPKGHHSSTYQLTKAFVKGFLSQKDADITTIHIKDLHIKPCLGCFSCWKNTPGKCCLDDDMSLILEKELEADIIIYSFPLYYYGMPGPLKTVIDRQLPLVSPWMTQNEGMGSGSHAMRYEMNHQYILISTCGFYSAKNN